MLGARAVALRVLRLYDTRDSTAAATVPVEHVMLPGTRVHARSRFRNVSDDARVALYAVQDVGAVVALDAAHGGRAGVPCGEHTLVAVREFRRVPLDAASLALTIFTARPGLSARLAEALAALVERAVDLHQPYVLLARSLEDPRTMLLLTAGAPEGDTFEQLDREMAPMLSEPPESYLYWPEVPADEVASPHAV